MQGNERWPPGTNSSARLRAARAMPPWIQARGTAIPPPPPPPVPVGPPPIEPEYEVIEFGQQTYSNQPAIKSNKEKKRCDLCGSSVPAVRCMQCVQQNFCYSCDEMYHRHPKRQSHIRKELDGGKLPPLPPKGEPPPPPVPPPRRNKRATPRPTPTPPNLPPGPHILQRDSVSPKPGFVGSLKRMVGTRPLPLAPHTMDRQNSLPPSASMMNFHDQQMMNGFPDWTDMHRGHRSGSFSALNPSNFGTMMQAQSMAQLNCPSCHGHGMWTPWGGMGAPGSWQSQALMNSRGRDDWSESDSDGNWQRERLRRFSTMSARAPKGYICDDTASQKGGRKRQDSDGMLNRGGRRQEADTMSIRGGRRQDFDTLSSRGGRRQELDTMSLRGGRKQDLETMSLRGGRRSDLESPSFRSQRRYLDERSHRAKNHRDSDSSDERETDEDFPPVRSGKKAMSDLEDVQKGRRRSEPPTSVQHLKKSDSTLRKKTKRNERFSDTGRRRSSPINYKYESPSGEEEEEEDEEEKEPELANGHDTNDKVENGIEYIDADAKENEEDDELAPISDIEWECAHCTFINEPGIRVCVVCCKTSTQPKVNTIQPKAQLSPQPKAQLSPQPKTQLSPQPKAQSNSQPKSQNKSQPKSQTPPAKLDDDLKKLNLEDKQPKVDPPKNQEKIKERRGTLSPERNPRTHTTSTGTSPPPQSISTQTYEEGGRKLTRATSLADYSDWKAPQRSASRTSLLSDTQSLPVTPPRSGSPEQFRQELTRRPSDLFMQRSIKRAGSQPPEYLSTLVQKQVKQGLEMVKLLREAEENQFAAEDLAVSLVHCGDNDPISWLQDNWRNMIDTVVTLSTNYGQERKENTVGTISASEARDALRMHDGNVWAAVTECVEQRQKKYGELLSRGNFSREDIVTVLTANHGNLEEAYKELNKNQLRPFLMRIWGPPQGAENDDGDFTKLAHGDVEGRGGKNSEEVSVDLSVDSNYERIQNWLEDYVHSNSKLNVSQSMLHVNSGGLKRSASDWKVNNPLINSRSNSTIFKNIRNSDIHRYLTTLYNANDKTLFLNKHSTSTLNLSSNEKNNSILVSENQKQDSTVRRLSLEKAKSDENYVGDIETITIKLNPTIVRPVEGNIQTNQQKEESSSDSSESSSEETDSDSESSDNNESHEFSKTLNADTQHLQVEVKSINETASVSGCQSDISESKQQLSRSNSQTSNESFESVHSSINEKHNTDKIKSSKEHIASEIVKRVNDLLLPEISNPSRDNSLEPDSHDYVNINFNRSENLNSPINNTHISKNSPIRESTKSDDKSEINIEYLDSNISTLSKKRSPNSSLSTNESNEKYEEVSSEDEFPFIEDTSDIPPFSDKIEIRTVPVAAVDIDILGDESDDSNFHSSEIPNENGYSEKRYDKRNRNNTGKNSGNLLVPNRRRIMAKRQRQHYAMSKSDSDMNDERSVDFSEESLEYNEGKRRSPLAPLKRDPSLRFSEGNSDRDASSIPTDSEKEPTFDNKKTKFDNQVYLNNDIKKIFNNSQAELLDLLKKNLSKDDVVEKLVSTLFASVLQASVDANAIKEQQKFVDSKKTFSQIINETTEEQLQSFADATALEKTNYFDNIEQVKNIEIMFNKDEKSSIEEQVENNYSDNRKEIEMNNSEAADGTLIDNSNDLGVSLLDASHNEVGNEVQNEDILHEVHNEEILNSQHEFPTEEIPLHEFHTEEIPLHEFHTEEIPLHEFHTEEIPLHEFHTEEIPNSLHEFHTEETPSSLHEVTNKEISTSVPAVSNEKIGTSVAEVSNLEVLNSLHEENNEETVTCMLEDTSKKIESSVPVDDDIANSQLDHWNNEISSSFEDSTKKMSHNQLDITSVAFKSEKQTIKETIKPDEVQNSSTSIEDDKSKNLKGKTVSVLGKGKKKKLILTKPSAPKTWLLGSTNFSQNIKVPSVISNIKQKEKILLEKIEHEFTASKVEDEGLNEEYNPERDARRLLAEGLVTTYQQALVAVQLKELKLDDEMILSAATECNSLEAAVAYLQQECLLCAGKYSVKQMISMLECEHVCCMECASNYFTLQITERNINDCVCPFCKEPDIIHLEEDKALTYFSNLDIFLKRIVKENIHELFQRKLRDRTLMQDPNFKWCVKCSSGFIANPRQTKLMCPDCKAITCAKCMKHWEKEHDNMSCEEYKTWLEQKDPEHQLTVQHLDENGVTCPNCKSKYILAKGGCMHLTCPQCSHEFCSGCSKPFLMGKKCTVSDYCEKLGLHSHHPRNCLFYLRDKEPEELERLLEDNKIPFDKTVETDSSKRCNVQLLKETSDGMIEGTCGFDTVKAGFCRKHYVDWLSRLVRCNSLETMCLLDTDDLETVVRRSGRRPPPNPYGTPRPVYRAALLQDPLR